MDGSSVLQGQVNQTAAGLMMIGFKNTGASYSYTAMPYALYFNNGTFGIYETGANRGSFGSYSLNTLYDFRIVLKGGVGNPTGARYYYKPASSSNWILLYDSSYSPGYSSMKVGASYSSGTFVIDNLVLQGGAYPFSGERPVIILPQAGNLLVTLKVTDGAGQSHSASTILTISAEPAVVTAPWQFSGGIEVPHDTWSGEEVIFKAVAKSRHTPLTYSWDFGDGTSASGTVTNLYDVSARHTYTAAPGTPFVARVTVTDVDGRTSSDTFPVIVRDKTLDVEVNKAIDDALWYLHTTQDRTSSIGSWHSSNYSGSFFGSQTASS
ncbi:MAG: PKD domain-containing protein, partial [Nitrospirota bacterium]|nr:PKD domain-containing protein [Nitrospirota bacterium]